MTDTPELRPLHLHTVDSLCVDLISGRAVGIGAKNEPLQLKEPASRSILNWYRLNRKKWSSPVREDDVDTIVNAAVKPSIPVLPTLASKTRGPLRRLRLTRLRAHRFAGLHGYGTPSRPPEDFVFEPAGAFSLFEGVNGSGKTSIVNAVSWCLTGHIYRPQREPESAENEFSLRLARDVTEAPEGFSVHELTPVTPMPDPARFDPAPDVHVPVDTSVTLSFVDDDGEVFEIRRAQSRTSRGRVATDVTDVRHWGIDPIGFRIGTLMPGMIPHVQLGDASELGHAVAELTGLAPLAELAKHARRVQARATKVLPGQRQNEIDEADRRFLTARTDLVARLDEYPAMAPVKDPQTELPFPSTDTELSVRVTALITHFENCKADALEAAKTTLGAGFDPTDAAARADLERCTGPARGELAKLAALKSAARLKGLGTLTPEEVAAAQALITEIRRQCRAFAELSGNPPLARRQQLYARVAAWFQEDGKKQCGDDCPVCSADIRTARDPVTGNSVRAHIDAAMGPDAEVFGQTIATWTTSTLRRLARDLPKALQAELDIDLPAQPRDLIRIALVDELFSAPCFAHSLAPLRKTSEALCDRHVTILPALQDFFHDDAESTRLPAARNLYTALTRVEKALAFSQWRRAQSAAIRAALTAVVGAPSDSLSLSGKISALESTLAGTVPINAAIMLSGRMESALTERRKLEKRIADYLTTTHALEPVIQLGGLVEQQVSDLQRLLHARTVHWRSAIYQKTHTTAHDLVNVEVDIKGNVAMTVGSPRVSAPAQHVSNASALRANLVAFFLAFWEHVLLQRGGLRLLLLDDPQELLDAENRERLADALPELIGVGGQLLVTTLDRQFARFATLAARRAGIAGVEHRAVFPVTTLRQTVEIPLAVDCLDHKRRIFLRPENVDVARFAQEYAAEVRVFVEARLAALFDDPAYSVSLDPPMLGDLLGRLRSKVKLSVSDFFGSPIVVEFSKHAALADGSASLKVLQRAHHKDRDLISYMDVAAVKEELHSVCAAVNEVHEEFRRWRQRHAAQPPTTTAIPLPQMTPPAFAMEIHRDLAAFTGTATARVAAVPEDKISGAWFAEKALFYVRSEGFGFAAPAGSIAIVEVDSTDVEDKRLVIARWGTKVLARRLARSGEDRTRIGLVAQAPNPLKSPPSLIVSTADAQIFRVVGILLDDNVMPPHGSREEAVQVSEAPVLDRVEAAFRVSGNSALPLALPGQVVLGGAALSAEDLGRHEGKLVALALADGSAVLKRIGSTLPSPFAHVRLFESVGFGESLLIRTEELEAEGMKYPLMVGARLVVGVLYTAA